MYELRDRRGRSHGKNYVTVATASATAIWLKLEDGWTAKFSWGNHDETAGTEDLRGVGKAIP